MDFQSSPGSPIINCNPTEKSFCRRSAAACLASSAVCPRSAFFSTWGSRLCTPSSTVLTPYLFRSLRISGVIQSGRVDNRMERILPSSSRLQQFFHNFNRKRRKGSAIKSGLPVPAIIANRHIFSDNLFYILRRNRCTPSGNPYLITEDALMRTSPVGYK
mgnify:CR=1 FL=1